MAGKSIDLAPAATVGNDGIVVTTNTVDVSSVATVNDDARHADGNWTVRTTDVGDSFDAAPRLVRFARSRWIHNFGEGRTRSKEDTSEHTATALVNAQSIVLQGFHVTEPIVNNFMFEESAESDLTNARAIHGTPDHSSVNNWQAVERFMANLSVAWTDRRDQIIVGEIKRTERGRHTRRRRARIRNILRCPH